VNRPHNLTGIVEAFGDVRSYIKSDGTLRPAWEASILAVVELPRPLPLAWDRDTKVTRIRCHKRLVAEFAQAFRNVDAADLWSELKDYGGCFNFRTQRGSGSKISTHAWGIAIDLSVNENPLGAASKLHVGVIQAFEAAGFFWGGRFGRPDAQHFQFAEGY
jgi:D-alanyl-D-alanine carboxypeptidase